MEGKKRVYHLTELKPRRRDLRQKSTKAEKLLWERLRNNKLGVKFRRQFSVMGYVVDFYCPQYRLIVELKGGVHKTASSKKYDDYRRKYLESFWMTIIEFWNDEVGKDIEGVISSIKSHLTQPFLPPHPPLPRAPLQKFSQARGLAVGEGSRKAG